MTVVNNWMVRCYGATVCTAIRRECDGNPTTSSLARCLETLIECPHFVSRERWVNAVMERGTDDELKREVARSFDGFATAGEDWIDPRPIVADLERLRAAAG